MITINTAESALKNIYLETVVNDINTKTNPFLTMIQKNTKTIAGKDAKASVRFGNEGAVGAGTEDGELPRATDSGLAEIVTPLKNLYGTFQITDKALKAAANNPGAFTSLLGGEMQNLVATAQNNLNRMIYGNGRKFLAHTNQLTFNVRIAQIPLRFQRNLRVGTGVVITNASNQPIHTGPITIQSITPGPGHLVVVFTGNLDIASNQDRFYIYEAGIEDLEMNGIDSIFLPDTMYNLAKADYREIQPFTSVDANTTLRVISEDILLEFFDALEEHAGGQATDIILTHPRVRKALFDDLKDNRSNIDVTEFEGGFKGFSFNGIPMYSDINCKGGTLYAVNSAGYKTQQLCDWTWIESEDGSILKPISGKPIYSATLVKYADLVCEKPFVQGKLTGFSARQWK
ncbi:MAG: phage major capsid protein [Firmicutes bacterium]|nr:phage major capsid protein [Bacillota bacterium]